MLRLPGAMALALFGWPAHGQTGDVTSATVPARSGATSVPDTETAGAVHESPAPSSVALTNSASVLAKPEVFLRNVQTPAITLTPPPGSARTSITFGDWQIGENQTITGPHDLYFYHGPTKQAPIDLTTDGVPILQYVFNGNVPDSAYKKTASPLTVNYVFGSTLASTGTGIAIQCSDDIRAEGRPDEGRNEHACYYGFVRADGHWPHPAGQNYWVQDFNLLTPLQTSIADRPNYIVGESTRIMNMSAGAEAIDSDHAGSFGSSVVTVPPSIADLTSAGMASTATTYPLSALYQASGWSGKVSVTDGTSVDAGPAATYAFRSGGGGGSAYVGNSARSYFDIGYGVYDWAKVGIDINSRNRHGSGPGLRNAYATELGGSGVTGVNSALLINKNVGTNYAAIQFGDAAPSYSIGTNSGPTGGDSFFVYSNSQRNYPLKLMPNAAAFGVPVQLPAQTFVSLPTCDAKAAGTIAYITDASVAISSWHQAVTKGGGDNNAFVACNGSGWFAWDY
jgi:hypothetical protein